MGKMEGYCSTGQSPQLAVVLVEEEEELGFLQLKAILSVSSTSRLVFM
jgi:hypothetical protein